MRRHPPISTRFPDTTLFRSRNRSVATRRSVRAAEHRFRNLEEPDRTRPEGGSVIRPAFPPVRTAERRQLTIMFCDLVDRKSTRLNSSHANISYAVFCLTKKK